MKLNNNSTYSDLKKWFLDDKGEIREDLPDTLDAHDAYYCSVRITAKMYITNVDREFERLGAVNIRRSSEAKASKNNLFRLYKALQVESNWNAPRPRLKEMNYKKQ